MATARLPRAERREQVLRAAAAAFLRGGFDGTSMDDVAAEAGVTRLIVYRIFETKDALYRSVLDEVSADLYASFGAPGALDHGVSSVLLGVGRRHPDAVRLLWRHAAHEPAFAELSRLFRELATAYAEDLVGEHVPAREFRHWMAQTLLGYHWDGMCNWLDDGDPSLDDEFVAMAGAGSRALVQAWVNPGALPRSRARAARA